MTHPWHLVSVYGTSWAAWEWMSLRATGMPFELLDGIADVRCDVAAREVLDVEDRVRLTRRIATGAMRLLLDELSDDQAVERREARRVLRALWRSGDAPLDPATWTWLEPVGPARTSARRALDDHEGFRLRLAEAKQNLDEAHRLAMSTEAKRLCSALLDARVAEALVWQNRSAFRRLRRSLNPDEPRLDLWSPNDRERADLRLALSYLQRYCAKNDTIGFFGPVAWVRSADWGPSFAAAPKRQATSRRQVRWETWGLEQVGEGFARDVRVTPWLVPRRVPTVSLTEDQVRLPFSSPYSLDPAALKVLELCDGSRTTQDVARAVSDSTERVVAIVDSLAAADLLDLRVPIPLGLNPEGAVARWIETLPAEPRQIARNELDDLLRLGEGVAESRGDPTRLAATLDVLDGRFTDMTGQPAVRGHGRMYAARSLVYEECRHDPALHIGSEFLEEIGGSLSPVLESARWLTARLIATTEVVLHHAFKKLASTGGRTIWLTDLWLQAHDTLFDRSGRVYAPVLAEFHRRWSTVLSEGERSADEVYLSDELAMRCVRRAFGSPERSATVRYYCPDLMIAAASPGEVRHGDYRAVLGELHLGTNTLAAASFVGEHPCPDDLARARALDLGPHYVDVAPSRDWGFSARTVDALRGVVGHELIITRDADAVNPQRSFLIGDFTVGERGGALVAQHRNGRHLSPILDLLGSAIAPVITDAFSIAAPAEQVPRVRIGRLVVARRGWRMRSEELSFVDGPDAPSRHLEFRRALDDRGVPRRVYVRVAGEPKPVFVDTASVTGVDLLAKLVRSSRRHAPEADTPDVTLTEMLPDPDNLWFRSKDDERHTTEFRLVVVDRSTDNVERGERKRHAQIVGE